MSLKGLSRFSRHAVRRHLRRRLGFMPLEQLEGRMLLSISTGTSVWTGASDNIWTNPDNWQGNVVPQPGDDLIFPAGAVRTVSVNTFAAGTTFNSVTISGPDYSLFGGQLNLLGGISCTDGTGSSTYRIDTNLGSGQITVAPGGTLTLNNVLSGTSGLTLDGGGTLAMTGGSSNTYTGTTTLTEGTLQLLRTGGALAVPGDLSVGDGSGLDLVEFGGSDQLAATSNLIISSSGTVDLGGYSQTLGDLTMTAGTISTGAGTLTLAGNLSVNAAALSPSITGHLDLGATSHAIAVADGAASDDLVIAADIDGLGGSIVKTGAGRLNLAGANTFTGGIAIASGTATATTPDGLSYGQLTVSNGATLELPANVGAVSNDLSLAGTGQANAGVVHFLSGSGELAGHVTLTGDARVAVDAGTLEISGDISDQANGYHLEKSGNGTLLLSNANAYAGGTIVGAGAVRVTDSNALGTGANTVIAGATLELDGTVSIGGALDLAGMLRSVSGTNMYSGNILITASTGVVVDGGQLTLGGNLDDGAAGKTLTKSGAGTLVLAGSNTYTGSTTVNGGLLVVTGSIATSPLFVTGAALAGNGTVADVNAIGSTLAPGNGSVDVLTAGNLTLGGVSTVLMDLEGNTAGPGAGHHDQIDVTGTVSLASAALSVSVGGGYTPGPGDQLVLINNDGVDPVAGTFAGLPEASYVSLGAGNNFRITYTGGTGNDVVLVYVQDSTTSLTADVNPSVHGQGVTLTATVSALAGTPTGNVTFFDNNVDVSGLVALDGSGQATFTSAALSTGSHDFTVVYYGDLADAPSVSSVLTQVVDKAATTTTLVSGTNPTVFGQSTALTVTVTADAPGAGTPTGSVTLFDGATAIAGPAALDGLGQAVFNIADLPVATHSLSVVYAGDADFGGSTSASVNQVVNQASTTTAVTSTVNPTVFGQLTTLSASVAASAPGAGTPTGTVDFYDGATLLGTSSLDGAGVATLGVSSLSVGAHATITAVYNGDAGFAGSTSNNFAQTVNQAASITTLTSDTSPSVFGQGITLTATVAAVAPGAGTPTGTVTLLDGGNPVAGPVAVNGSGQATFSVSGLSVGTHSLTVDYSGDAHFTLSSAAPLSQVVDQAGTTATIVSNHNPAVHGQPLALSVTVSAAAPGAGTPGGNVTFYDNNVDVSGPVALDGSGQAVFNSAALTTGTHSFTVVYDGDASFTASTSDALSQVVDVADTTTALVSSQNPTVFGESTTLTATVSASAPGAGTPTGSVSFFDGVTPIGAPVVLVGGVAALPVASLATGSHSISAVYLGDVDFNASTSNALSQDVNQASTTTGLATSGTPSVFGESITLTATVAAAAPGAGTPTGSVDFFDGATNLGTATLSGGVATLGVSSLAVGPHANITAVYNGDVDFTTSTSAPIAQTVDQADTTATIASDANPSAYGQTVHLTATVGATAPGAGTPTGTVQFYDNGVPIGAPVALDGSGQATLAISSLSLGAHANITADYSGDASFNPSSAGAFSQTVNPDASSTALLASVNPTVFGQGVTFTATVTAAAPGSGLPTGTVQFYDGANPLGAPVALDGSGVATLTTSALAAGSHSITAVYSGDADFSSSTSSATTQGVNQADTTVAATVDINPSLYGQPITVSVTLVANAPGAGTPTGLVILMDGPNPVGIPAPLVGGAASFTPALSTGSHSLSVLYLGDPNFAGSTSNTISQSVDPSATSTTVSPDNANTVYGQDVTFTAAVVVTAPGTGTPGGTVQFYDGASPIGSPTALDGSGVATLTIGELATGSHSITAVYSGDDNFVTSTSPVSTQTISQASTTANLSVDINPSVYRQTVTLTATITADAPSALVPTGTVMFFDGATLVGTAALDGGVATLPIASLAVGTHAGLTAVYTGSADFVTSTSNAVSQEVDQAATTTTLASDTSTSVWGQSVTFTATVSAVAPGSGIPTGTVTFLIDGTPAVVPLDAGGQATLTTSALEVGSHSVTAAYSGDANDLTSAAALPLPQIVHADWVTISISPDNNPVVIGQPVTFTATLLAMAPGSGTPTGLVQFMIDGDIVTAPIPLDGSGQASFTTSSLSLGTPGISLVYGGDAHFYPLDNLESPLSIQVNPAATSVALTSSSNPSVYGQSTTLTATVSVTAPGAGTPTGAVVFYDGATILGTVDVDGQGVASLSTSTLGVGSRSITAAYSGDADLTPGNSAPLFQNVSQALTTASLAVSSASVPYGTSVTLTAAIAAAAPSTAVPGGVVSFFDNGSLLGTAALSNAGVANLTLSNLAIGDHPDLTVSYAGSAGFSGSVSSAQDVLITNNAPTTIGISGVNTTEDATLQSINLASYFADAEDGANNLTYTLVNNSNPSLFSGVALNGHSLTLQLAPDENGSASITIRATDSGDQQVQSTFTVTVQPVNDAPSFTLGDDQEIDENAGPQTVPGWAGDLSAGPANESSQVTHFVTFLVTEVSDASLFAVLPSISPDGTLTYTPADNQFGTATISVQIVDDGGTANGGHDSSAAQTFTITVDEVPDNDPVAQGFSVSHTPGSSLTIDALSHASDVDPDTLVLTVAGQPAGGSVTVDNMGSADPSDDVLVYTPKPGFYGADSFSYAVDDGRGGTATATVSITVAGAGYAVNPFNAAKRDLVVVGTSGNDVIKFDQPNGSNAIAVTINGVSAGSYLPNGRVVAMGGNGNDVITCGIRQLVVCFGGNGNDKLVATTGPALLLGGTGNDTLTGGAGRDILIGGTGRDVLRASGSGDILIGGTTRYDGDTLQAQLALSDLQTAWNSRARISSRIDAIITGVGSARAKLTAATARDDDEVDILTGSNDNDWFFGRKTGAKDTLKLFNTGDVITWVN